MITYIKGEVLHANLKDTYVQLEIVLESGIGYLVAVPTRVMNLGKIEVNKNISLYTSFQVRADTQTLYGFMRRRDRDLFETLIGVSGIGPRIGIAMLSTFTVEEVGKMLKEGDFKGLSKVSGLGPKGAKKIILELQGKLEMGDESPNESGVLGELRGALKSLGFGGKDLEKMITGVAKKANEGTSIEDLVQLALRDE